MVEGVKMVSKRAWRSLLLALVTSFALLSLQLAGPTRVVA